MLHMQLSLKTTFASENTFGKEWRGNLACGARNPTSILVVIRIITEQQSGTRTETVFIIIENQEIPMFG